jgi:hypothetical protein
MARIKPRIKIPYKRYEKSFDRTPDTGGQDEDGFVVLKDITANPSIVTTNLKHERPVPETGDENSSDNVGSDPEPDSGSKEISLNKKIKIRRKLR